MAKFKKADGTEVDLDGVTDAQITAYMAIASDVSAAALAGVAGTIETVVRQAVEPLAKRVDQWETADAPAKGKKPASAEPDEPPAWAKGLIDTVGSITKEREDARSRAETERRCGEYLNRTRPNMAPAARKRLLDRLVAAAPKDDAGLAAATKDALDELKDFGVDVAKLNTASPAGEGAKPPTSEADAAAASKAKREEIRKAGPGGLRPVAARV